MYDRAVVRTLQSVLAELVLFRRVGAEDRERVASVASLREYERGETIFDEGDPSDHFFVVVTGRAKVFKRSADGHDVILEMFGPGGPLGAVAAYESRPYPASAAALEPTSCLLIPRQAFFALLERHPSLVRGLLGSLSLRLVELTTRLADMSGGRVDVRLARLFLKLAEQLGRPDRGGIFIPLPLGRQELADFTGTTIETAIRIMSRWNRDGVVRTEKDGFVVVDKRALETFAGG
jgi:CRP/FNR family transcriptional regulator